MKKNHCLLFVFFFCTVTFADPWFTGPLLAPSGRTVPLGHANFEAYGFSTSNTGTYDRGWKIIDTPAVESTQFNPLLAYGLTDKIDVQWSLPYSINRTEHRTGRHIGDTSVLLGFQAYTQKPGSWVPNLRITLQEIFPTGRYDGLNPIDKGTGATGAGSYQSVIGLNFQDLWHLRDTQYLRTRLAFAYLYANPASIHGYNTFGGARDTMGHIKPGNLTSIDLAGELSVTQNWVLVMEGYYIARGRSTFIGTPGVDHEGKIPRIGHYNIAEISLAPAIEYNFSANYGIIAGYWYSVKGKDAPDFSSIVVAFNAFW